MGGCGKGRFSINQPTDELALCLGLAGWAGQKQTRKFSSQGQDSSGRSIVYLRSCTRLTEPLINDASFSYKAHCDELTPELRNINTSLCLSPVEIGSIGIDDAWSGHLRPVWGVPFLKPAPNGLTLHADDFGDFLMRGTLCFQSRGFLKTGLSAGQSCLSRGLGDSPRPPHPFDVMTQDVAGLGTRVEFCRNPLGGSGMAVDQGRKRRRKDCAEDAIGLTLE